MDAHRSAISEDGSSGLSRQKLVRQFASFLGVGALGFVLDVALFLFATEFLGWTIAWARALSALCSITATWALNRRVTFADRSSSDRKSEYLRYLLAQIGGLAINLATFAICLAAVPGLRQRPTIALVIGAATALFVNFLTARNIAFRRNPDR